MGEIPGLKSIKLFSFIHLLIHQPILLFKIRFNNVDKFVTRSKYLKENLPVELLFTNIPLERTIEKLVANLFNEIGRRTYNFDGVVFNKESLTKALEFCGKDQLFLFNGELWKQIDGNSIGSLLLGPAPLANFFNLKIIL